jgi:hypothetical protein
MKKSLQSLFSAAVLLAFASTPVMAYDGGPVSDGGSISVAVKFKGTPPTPKKLEVSKDKVVCGKSSKTDPSLIVS